MDRVEGADAPTLVKKLDDYAADLPKESKENALNERIAQLIHSADVILFMKGNPDAPRCGFSSRVIDALNEAHIQFSHFDILQDEAIRQVCCRHSCLGTDPRIRD